MHTKVRPIPQFTRLSIANGQFDFLVRAIPVLDAIEETGPAAHTLLDVGSGSTGIAPLLAERWQVTMVDPDFDDYGSANGPRVERADAVIGDVRALPFEDQAFDVVVALDLLEHVPPEDRETAIGELCRVSRRRAVIACPAGAGALGVDRRLADRMRERGHPLPGWLDEHLRYGFSEPDDLAATAAAAGHVRLFGNEALHAHERLMNAENGAVSGRLLRLGCAAVERMLISHSRRSRRFARWVLWQVRARDEPPTYRAVISVDIGSD